MVEAAAARHRRLLPRAAACRRVASCCRATWRVLRAPLAVRGRASRCCCRPWVRTVQVVQTRAGMAAVAHCMAVRWACYVSEAQEYGFDSRLGREKGWKGIAANLA